MKWRLEVTAGPNWITEPALDRASLSAFTIHGGHGHPQYLQHPACFKHREAESNILMTKSYRSSNFRFAGE